MSDLIGNGVELPPAALNALRLLVDSLEMRGIDFVDDHGTDCHTVTWGDGAWCVIASISATEEIRRISIFRK